MPPRHRDRRHDIGIEAGGHGILGACVGGRRDLLRIQHGPSPGGETGIAGHDGERTECGWRPERDLGAGDASGKQGFRQRAAWPAPSITTTGMIPMAPSASIGAAAPGRVTLTSSLHPNTRRWISRR
jgi:hypothetical protein